MNKKILGILFFVFLVVLSFFYLKSNNNGNNTSNSDIILFYGEGCSHCQIVDDYLNQNKVEEKVKFQKKEVFNNKDNANLLVDKATFCKLDTQTVGVPFLWDGQKCLTGDVDVINFFQEKIK